MTNRTGIDTGVMVLYSWSGDYWRILSSDNVSPNIQIPSQFAPYWTNWSLGENYLFVSFYDSNRENKITALVYDLTGKLVNTVLTPYNNREWTDCSGDRLLMYLYSNPGDLPDTYLMVTSTSSARVYDFEVNTYWMNDTVWID
jgi:hypothetical protein